jgi:D-alanyl-D-alanine dipeptidase
VFVLTGYTSPACLRGLWELHLDHARMHAPDADEQRWRAYAKTRVRDPELFDANNPRTWPAHTTGGAVDLCLRDLSSARMLEMGSQFEELAPVSNSDYFERQLADGLIGADDIRLRNRRLLHWAMSAEGFVNEPPLYWHFDWGNQLYIKTLRATLGRAPATAWYGFGGPTPDEQGPS